MFIKKEKNITVSLHIFFANLLNLLRWKLVADRIKKVWLSVSILVLPILLLISRFPEWMNMFRCNSYNRNRWRYTRCAMLSVLGLKNALSVKTLSLKEYIPVTRKPDYIFAGVTDRNIQPSLCLIYCH